MKNNLAEKTNSQEILKHYSRFDESSRLNSGFGQIQFHRSKELILRYLKKEPQTILDVGGACGQYSFWLAELGHKAHLIDIVPHHIDKANALQENSVNKLASLHVGDALSIEFPDEFADAVLLFGPIYHLVNKEDRIRALKEALRALKPHGQLFVHAINRYSGIVFGTTRGFVLDPEYMEMTRNEVRTGLRSNAPAWLNSFSQAHFHHPDELRDEIIQAGFKCEGVYGVVGCAWQVPDLDEELKNPTKKASILEVARLVENDPVISPDMLAVCTKK